jgi:CSLREA domain-containing protein/uncharacterized repeat protein (TIGR01451 family)
MKFTLRRFQTVGRSGLRPLLIATLVAALALGVARPLPVAADSNIVVTSTADTAMASDGQCTLREAILNANGDSDSTGGDCAAGSGADTITFGVTGTIALGSTLPDIGGDLTISGPGAANLTISGANSVRVLRQVNVGVQLALDNLMVANGKSQQGGAIFNRGLLRISNSAFVNNASTAYGGAIFNQGAYMTVTDSTFSGNSATSGGAGIYNQPLNPGDVLLISGGTFTGNSAAGGAGLFTLDGTVLLSGEFSGNTASQGAGVYSDRGALTVTSSRFSSNSASSTGGAIFFRGAYNLSVDTTTFSGNSAGMSGAGIYSEDGTVIAQYNTFTNNDATGGSGGGISSGGTLAVSYSTFSGNRGGSGGGLAAIGPLTMTSSVFSDNQVTNSGGAMVAYAEATVSDSSITGNSATRSGGGIWSYQGATVLVRNSTVANNSTTLIGGGLSNEGGALTIVNSTVASNSSGSIGGGIDNRGSLTVIHSTLSGNSAVDLGSAIRNATTGASVTLRNTIVVGSAAKANCGGPIGDGGYNIDSGTSCGLSQANNSKPSTNPQLDPAGLQLNSGTTKTIALLPSSPAVNAVPQASCTDQNNAALAADQRGAARPYGPACDIGAFELQQDPPPPPPASADLRMSQSADRDPVVVGENVTFTLTASNAGPDTAQNVIITEQMQQLATFVSASAGCTYASANGNTNAGVTCNIGDLASGASASVHVTISSPFEGAIVTVASVGSSTGDPAPTNNSSTARVTVNPGNQAPTDIALSNDSVAENSPLGTAVGTFSTSDPDAGDTHTYALVPNFGDNASFTLDGATLKTNTALDFETRSSYLVAARSTDAAGLWFEKVFPISVTDVDEHVNSVPTIALAAGGSVSGAATGTMNLSVADADGNSLTLTGSSSNASLVPNANITFSGSGASRSVRITAIVPKKGIASATVTLTVSDGHGGTATTAITVTLGSSKKETLSGTAGADMIFGLDGDDTIDGGGGNDLISGDKGNDTLNGGDGNDSISGGDGNDKLTGGLGADAFSGGAGKDTAADFNTSQGDTQDGTLP